MAKPLFIARQAAYPRGFLGWIIAKVMSKETRWENQAAISRLDLRRGDSVLDVGCGHGASLPILHQAVKPGWVSGADPSPTMVKIAKRQVGHRDVEIQTAGADELPYWSNSFDAVLSVHTIYFWSDPVTALSEIRRVTKPGGRFVLCCRTTEDPNFKSAAPAPVYHARSLDEVTQLLELAGWTIERREAGESRNALFNWFVCAPCRVRTGPGDTDVSDG
jgi:ubiquinone/menaquinone biosynthesis C-methylase UbiE